MCERSMNWAFKIIKTLTIFYSDPDATTFTHGFSTSNLLACRVIPSCLWSLFMFTSVARGASFTIKRRLCTEINPFINFTAFVIDLCKAWKIYNFKIRLGEW